MHTMTYPFTGVNNTFFNPVNVPNFINPWTPNVYGGCTPIGCGPIPTFNQFPINQFPIQQGLNQPFCGPVGQPYCGPISQPFGGPISQWNNTPYGVCPPVGGFTQPWSGYSPVHGGFNPISQYSNPINGFCGPINGSPINTFPGQTWNSPFGQNFGGPIGCTPNFINPLTYGQNFVPPFLGGLNTPFGFNSVPSYGQIPSPVGMPLGFGGWNTLPTWNQGPTTPFGLNNWNNCVPPSFVNQFAPFTGAVPFNFGLNTNIPGWSPLHTGSTLPYAWNTPFNYGYNLPFQGHVNTPFTGVPYFHGQHLMNNGYPHPYHLNHDGLTVTTSVSPNGVPHGVKGPVVHREAA